MSTTTYTTTIDFDYRAKRDNGRRNNTRECYIRDVMALRNVEPKKKKGTLWKPGSRGGRFGKSSERVDI